VNGDSCHSIGLFAVSEREFLPPVAFFVRAPGESLPRHMVWIGPRPTAYRREAIHLNRESRRSLPIRSKQGTLGTFSSTALRPWSTKFARRLHVGTQTWSHDEASSDTGKPIVPYKGVGATRRTNTSVNNVRPIPKALFEYRCNTVDGLTAS